MKIWVDADACPVVVREILFKAAERTEVELTLVANQAIQVWCRSVSHPAMRSRLEGYIV